MNGPYAVSDIQSHHIIPQHSTAHSRRRAVNDVRKTVLCNRLQSAIDSDHLWTQIHNKERPLTIAQSVTVQSQYMFSFAQLQSQLNQHESHSRHFVHINNVTVIIVYGLRSTNQNLFCFRRKYVYAMQVQAI